MDRYTKVVLTVIALALNASGSHLFSASTSIVALFFESAAGRDCQVGTGQCSVDRP
jgi:hypothetical protein